MLLTVAWLNREYSMDKQELIHCKNVLFHKTQLHKEQVELVVQNLVNVLDCIHKKLTLN